MTCSTSPAARFDACPFFAATEQAGVVDVPGGQIGQRAAAAVLELHPPGALGARQGAGNGGK